MSDRTPNAHELIELAYGHGFALAGVAPLEPSKYTDAFRSWIDAGMHGEMAYLEAHEDVRLDPSKLIDGARSALMVADLYASRLDDHANEQLPRGHGRIAKYARGRDYHKHMKKRLHALSDEIRDSFGGETRAFVDTAPVLERELAQRAGIGWVGKHTLLIHPKAGSYMFMGGIATTLELEQDPSAVIEDHCGTCTRCIDACPTDAITPHKVDATRCIAYLTIEHRSAIDPELATKMGEWVFGCDVCQDVCPHNSPKDAAQLDERFTRVNAAYMPRAASFDLLDVLGWDEDARREHVSGTPMTRAKLGMLKRNVLIAAMNLGDDRVKDEARKIAGDPESSGALRSAAELFLSRRGE